MGTVVDRNMILRPEQSRGGGGGDFSMLSSSLPSQRRQLSAMMDHSSDVGDDDDADDDNADATSNKSTNVDEAAAMLMAQSENKAVLYGKLVVLTVLLLSALGIALAIFYYITHSERDAFHDQFHHDAMKIMEAIGSTLDITLGSMDAFLMVMASYAHASNMTWPFVTLVSHSVIRSNT